MFTENAFLAVLAGFIGIASPMLMAWMTNTARRKEKQQDWARQDAVAAQAAEAARLLVERQDAAADKAAEAARLLLASNERVAKTAAVTNNKLDVIHVLVNSNMTAAMQSEYSAVQRELVLMNELVAIKRVTGEQPSVYAISAIEATTQKIEELRVALEGRTNSNNKASAIT